MPTRRGPWWATRWGLPPRFGTHFPLDLLNGAGAEPDQPGGLQDSRALGQLCLRPIQQNGIRRRSANALTCGDGSRHAGFHPLPDHGAFELTESTDDLKDEPAHGHARIDSLPVEIEVDVAGVEKGERVEQIGRRSFRSDPADLVRFSIWRFGRSASTSLEASEEYQRLPMGVRLRLEWHPVTALPNSSPRRRPLDQRLWIVFVSQRHRNP